MGFGPEISLTLAEQGFGVYGGVQDSSEEEWLRNEASARRVTVHTFQMDAGKAESVEESVRSMVARAGGIYALINNAGRLLRGFFENLVEEEIERLFEINFFTSLAATRAALPYMRQARQGRIVFISSVAGRIAASTGSAYSSTRFAIEGFAESLSQEIQPLGIEVSLVEPGITKTRMWTVERSRGEQANNPHSPYYQWFVGLEKCFGEVLENSSIGTADVAGQVHRALTVKHPRLRYVVGGRPKIALFLRRYLPEKLFDRVFLRLLMSQLFSGPR
jgi:NAD(P)-dependent dehydrogenase (short-subunit alcohol dehydrogenase family)